MRNRNASIALLVLLAQGFVISGCGGPEPSVLPAANPVAATPAVPGTIVMMGTVSDTAFRHVTAAKIDVLNGPQAGMTTTSNARGEFSFTGVFDDNTRFRATKDGYALAELPLGPFCASCNPNRWVNFSLQALTPPVEIAGDYSMTLAVDGACTQMPASLRTRIYDARIPSSGSPPMNGYFVVLPTGAPFVSGWERFDGGVSGNNVGFWFESLVEQIAPNSYLIIGMYASGTVNAGASTISTVASGRIDFCTVEAGSGVLDDCFRTARAVHATCDTSRHLLTFTRR